MKTRINILLMSCAQQQQLLVLLAADTMAYMITAAATYEAALQVGMYIILAYNNSLMVNDTQD